MPHAIAIDNGAARCFGDAQHATVDIVGHAANHALRRDSKPLRPAPTHEIEVAADAARGNDNGLRLEHEATDHAARTGHAAIDFGGLQDVAFYAIDHTRRPRETINAMARAQRDEAQLFALAQAVHEWLDNAWPRAPGHMEARHGVAVPGGGIPAAPGPTNDGKPAHAFGSQPSALFASREANVGLGPLAGPKILLAVEAGRSQPVLQCEVVGITDAHTPLLRAVDEEEAAEGPEGLTAEGLLTLLIEHDDALACLDQFASGNKPSDPAADYDRIRIHVRPQMPVMVDCRQCHTAAGPASRHGLFPPPL